jgi:hypothetical protein
LDLGSQGKVNWPILIDEPKEFFQRAQGTQHRRGSGRWPEMLSQLWNPFPIKARLLPLAHRELSSLDRTIVE